MGFLFWLEWSAFTVGTIGTLFWAKGARFKDKPVEGWFWLISGILWIVFAVSKGHYGLALRDVLGVILYLIGLHRIYSAQNNSSLNNAELVVNLQHQRPSPICDICSGGGIHQLSGPGSTTCGCSQKSTIVTRQGH